MGKEYKNIKVSPCETYHLLSGNRLYKKNFSWVMKFHSPGLAPVADESGSYHIDTKGNAIYSKRYKKAYGFYDGCAAVMNDKRKWLHVNIRGNQLYSSHYNWCGNFQEDCCVVESENGFQHIVKSGEPLYLNYYDYVGDYKDGVSVALKDGKFFHINTEGQRINNDTYLFLDIFHKGFARAQDEKGWFHVNRYGIEAYKERYKYVEPYYNGFSLVQGFDNEFFRINETGKVIQNFTHKHFDPIETLSAKMVSFWSIYVISTSLTLGIFDFLPQKTKKIAQNCQADEENMLRLLRGLWELDLISHDKNMWQLTETGKLLTPSSESFMASASVMWVDVMKEWQSQGLLKLIKQQPKHHDCFKDNADKQDLRIYHHALIGYAEKDFLKICDYVMPRKKSQIFVAGACARVILPKLSECYSECFFTYYDMPSRLKDFSPWVSSCNIKVADFDLFSNWPGNYDYLIFPRYLHYWPDEDIARLLSFAVKQLNKGGKVLIFEMLISKNTPQGSLLDLNMLIETGGKLRSKSMWLKIMKSQNMMLKNHLQINNHLSLLEFCHV